MSGNKQNFIFLFFFSKNTRSGKKKNFSRKTKALGEVYRHFKKNFQRGFLLQRATGKFHARKT